MTSGKSLGVFLPKNMGKILFVEDDPDQIMIYDFKFKQEGMTLVVAGDEKETLAAIEREKPDIILLDILLKNENGMDILEKVRQDPAHKDLPVIMFTNFDKEGVRVQAEELGALDYIIKAQTYPQEMADKIKQFLATGKYDKGLKKE